jgi:hypothetical protein
VLGECPDGGGFRQRGRSGPWFHANDLVFRAIIEPVKLNISRPSADAPDSMAIYDKLRQMSADENAAHSDEDILSEVVSGLFNIVAKLESESSGG